MMVTPVLSSALMCATLVQCGFLDSFKDSLFSFGSLDHVMPMPDLSVDLDTVSVLASLRSEINGKLGDVPAEAFDAWKTVLSEVPEGAQKLKDGMLAKLNERLNKGNGRKKTSKHNDRFVTVKNDKFPAHALRVTSPDDLGVDKTKQYSGYLDVEDEDKHFFFWFFESRNDPENDPVVLWLNGGPGCSSLTGLFFELGPATIGADLKPVPNKDAWNNNANVIFLDQPVNTGYSYSSNKVSDTISASKDAYAFLELFFEKFPEYNNRDFHIAGESYAGHYIPVFGSEIMSHDDRGFNLTSLLIGNGLTDPLNQYDLYEPMACGQGGHESVLDESQCQGMLDSQPRCDQLIQSCYDTQSAWTCVPAVIYCNNAQIGPYQQTGLNVYDIREECQGDNGLCYPQLDLIDQYLNLPEVKEAVGADVETYQGCNFDVNRDFLFNGDWMKPYQTAVSELLEKEVPILIYAGDKDYICNWLGNEAWSRALPWSGHEEFSKVDLGPWVVDGEEAGQVRNHEHFTFLRVYEAGHMVPYNQPKNSLEMLERWISGDFTFA
ncbi:Carboxypeptidase Y [Wickerhamiella sorbophila]|uniref:Carboxypeptidase n=1 Tax=Wickerhamiella sorbophila TaxID=45607 RepID=A0A2T0FKR1_9ASCO|nr:Carboxypeptidase Y [Wickerhamiella sorbophila]PRT55557.1 Carboxypeptidase Y [Wickerhamiella sorbophila]